MARRLLPLAALAVVLVTAGVARAQGQAVDEQSEFEKGRNAYIAHQLNEADDRFQKMLDPKAGTLHDRILVNQARMYWGAVKIAKGQPDKASTLFEDLLMNDPTYDPDPLAFPTEVVNAFIDTRARLRERLKAIERDAARRAAERKAREEQERKEQAERLKTLERLAGEERTIVQNSRWIAFLPFGAGQFQNGQKSLGWVFLGTEAAFLTVAAITLPIYLTDLQYRNDAAAQGDTVRAQEYIDRAKVVRGTNLVADGAFAATWILGAVQAQLAFVPEEAHVTTRPLPVTPAPSVSWSVAPAPAPDGKMGLSLGVVGTF